MTENVQQSFFDISAVELISIEAAADLARVSSATIRNWIKAGHIPLAARGFTDRDMLTLFMAGKEGEKRLTSRANKSKKDEHDHELFSLNFIGALDDPSTSFKQISDRYEQGLSESYRNKEGIYYTPPEVVTNFLDFSDVGVENLTFLDPCCGSGNFLVRALELGFRPENVYGYDTDPNAVEITKRRILAKAGYATENVVHEDFLAASMSFGLPKFDVIFTNPPWGKKIDKDQKSRFAKFFGAGGSVDTCSLFMFASLSRLKDGGYLGLLLPDAFFNIAVFESARIRALNLGIKKLTDYGKPFKGLLTKAFGVVLRNESTMSCNEDIICTTKNHTYKRSSNSFAKNPKSIINFQAQPEAAYIIEHLLGVRHVTLARKAKWGLGVVTGNNEKFISDRPGKGLMPVYRGADITSGGLLPPSCFIPENLSLYQQVAPVELYEAPAKLIYKFISSGLCFFPDLEQRYVLNSINMVIPDADLGVSHAQIVSLLNSEVINWLFSSLFSTHKILRTDLESLPLHVDYFKQHAVFSEENYLKFLCLEKDKNGTFRIKKSNY